ncbi:MAG: DUF4350 domain-containing protein [Verrucomicrobiales bacterium]
MITVSRPRLALLLFTFCLLAYVFPVPAQAQQKRVGYIHGDVAANGTVPSGSAAAYDPMLITDTESTGLSVFRLMVEEEGYQITQHYDQATTLDAAFLDQFDAIIFSLHQKLWSADEKAALHTWLQAGGGMLIYSDSASGGAWNVVGIKNPVGQNVVNNLTTAYGLQVTVDQGGGTRAYKADDSATHPVVVGPLVLEGEGVSPVAVDPTNSTAQILIPFNTANRVSGGNLNIDAQGVTIADPLWASLAVQTVGSGKVVVMFDRQPMWNSGPGSDITKRDNREILRRLIAFLADDLEAPPVGPSVHAQFTATPSGGFVPLEVQFDASGSSAVPGPIVSYEWDFTDNGTIGANGPLTSFTFDTAGSYTTRLTVTDAEGNSDTATRSIPVADPGAVPADGLIAAWLFEESEGAIAVNSVAPDFSGTLSNAAREPGIVGNAVGFNGVNSTIQIPVFETPYSQLTISAWMRWEGASTFDARIISRATNTSANTHIWALGPHDNGRLRARLTTGSSTTEMFTPNGTISPNEWHHVVLRYTGTQLEILVDGEMVANTPVTGTIPNAPSTPIALGNQPAGAGDRPFHGLIDQVRIYSRALDELEILTLLQEPNLTASTEANFATWLASLPTVPPENMRGFFDDPDGDGMVNLLEYAFDGNPMLPMTAHLSSVSLELGSGSLTATIAYFKARNDLNYLPEYSLTLAKDSWVPLGEPELLDSTTGLSSRSITIPASDRLFMRMRVSPK